MKLVTLLLASLAPITLSASPIAATADVTPRDAGDDLLAKRAAGICRIVNVSSTVNCRSGPGTQYAVVTTFKKGQLLYFPCLKSGECITINGATNCGWDKVAHRDYPYCYINGHYTDNECTLAKIGRC